MPLPFNRNQLELLTSTQAGLIDDALIAGNLKVSELVVVSWPAPDDEKVYTWWNQLSDPAYFDALTDWLDGRPLVPAFVAKDTTPDKPGVERFHNIPRTAALSDDVIRMEFANYGQIFEELAITYKGGVRVEVFYFFPEIPDDETGKDYTVKSWFLGHLKKGGRANADFVPMNVVSGFRSPHVTVPSVISGSNCQRYYNGDTVDGVRVFPDGLTDNPCDIDLHFGGTHGTVDPGTGELWAVCNHTLADCTKINGTVELAREIYGGDDYITPSTKIGGGDHTTISKDTGNETRLDQPIPVPYGTFKARQLQLARFAKEYNPSEDHQDAGTIRTVFKIGHGPIEEISNVKVMDRPLPRTDGLGLESRLGTQRQPATTYAPNMMNLNRIAHFRGDINPVDPTGVQAQDIIGECDFKGRNTIKVYAADGSYTQPGFLNNRADILIDQWTDPHYGYKMDVSRVNLDDVVYLRSKESPFDYYVQGATVQQRTEDICGAAVGGGSPQWFRPFVYDGEIRILPIEALDLGAADIPELVDAFGSTRNILFDDQRKVTYLEAEYRDNDEIANSYILSINDADADFTDHPQTFEAYAEQYREGQVFGDESKRRDPKQWAAYGLTHVSDIQPLGEFLIKYGPFATGGYLNNCTIEFSICAISSLGLNLHENKVVKFPAASNPKLSKHKDADGNQFEYFLILSMERTSRLWLKVRAQAWTFNDTFCFTPGGTASGFVQWPTGDEDVIDGPNGARTMIYSVSEDFGARHITYPSSIAQSSVTRYYWTHTVSILPPTGKTYFVSYPEIPLGFLVWENGQVWIYADSGVDFAVLLPPGSVVPGDTLTLEWDKNGGSPVRRYKHNGTTLLTDASPTVITGAFPGIGANATADRVYIGDIFWYVEYDGCPTDFAVQGVGLSGTSVISGTPGTITELGVVGIGPEETFGTPTATPGAVSLLPAGLASSESFGTAVVAGGVVTIAPSGIVTSEAFGAATVASAADPDLALWIAAWKETGYANNDPVTGPVDFSSNARTFTQATSGKRPLYQTSVLNSQPGFLFDGTDDYWDIAAFMSGDAEMYAVMKTANNVEFQGCYKFDNCTSASHISFVGTVYSAFGGTGRFSYTPSPSSNLTNGFIHQIVAKAGSNEWKMYENGNNNKVTTTNTQGWSGGASPKHLIGASSDQVNGSTQTNFFHGHILEFRIYSSPRSTAQRNAILAEFNSKYGISVTNF